MISSTEKKRVLPSVQARGADNRTALATPGQFDSIEAAYAVLGPVMHAIVTAAGSHCEVVLHDLSSGDLRHSIHAIENGHVSGRDVGGPSTNLGIEVLNDQLTDHSSYGYRGQTADGRELHSSSVYFRNSAGEVIAALCINVDLTPLQAARSVLESLFPGDPDGDTDPREMVSPDIETILDSMIAEAITAVGKVPSLMDKPDRVEVFRLLESRGAFNIKRAVDNAAKRLGISRVTAYGYLDDVRRS